MKGSLSAIERAFSGMSVPKPVSISCAPVRLTAEVASACTRVSEGMVACSR